MANKKFILLPILFLAIASLPQHTVEHRVLGCWIVQLGQWQPTMAYEADSIFVTPPAKIEFKEEGGQEGRYRWPVLPANGAEPSIHNIAYFQAIGTDSLMIVWSTGYSGLFMRLAVAEDTLRGTAKTFWDFDRPQQTASVILVRIDCH